MKVTLKNGKDNVVDLDIVIPAKEAAHAYNKENKKPYIYCLNRCTDFFAFFMFVIYFIIRCPSFQYQIQKKE